MLAAITQNIRSVIKQGLARVLARDGFTRKGNWLFHRSWGASYQAVEIQLDKYNRQHKGEFTLNLGVDFPDVNQTLAPELRELRPGELLTSYECTLVWRIGHLIPELDTATCKDLWWKLGAPTDLAALSEQVVSVWEANGKPWLDQLSEPDRAYHAVSLRAPLAMSSLIKAAIDVLLGRKERARVEVQQMLGQSYRDQLVYPSGLKRAHDGKLVTWAIRMGVIAVSDIIAEPHSQSEFERCRGAYAIESLGSDAAAATPALAVLLEDNEPTVRRQAARALEAIGAAASLALPSVRKATGDVDPAVRYAATSALWSISPDVRPPGI